MVLIAYLSDFILGNATIKGKSTATFILLSWGMNRPKTDLASGLQKWSRSALNQCFIWMPPDGNSYGYKKTFCPVEAHGKKVICIDL